MTVALALAALAVVVAALVVATAIRRRAAALRARARRLKDDLLEPPSGEPAIVGLRARHLRTVVGRPPSDACLPELPSGVAGDLAVTEREIVLRRDGAPLHVPLARVRDATFVAAFEEERASEAKAILVVAWRRGGETLETALELAGRRLDAERVRREIHLRAGEARPPRSGD